MSLGSTVARVRRALHVRRLFVVPAVGSSRPHGAGGAEVEIQGLVCPLCAARAEAALAGLDAVEGVRVDLHRGVAELRLRPGHELDPAAMDRAITAVVVARPARRLLDRLRRALLAGRRAWRAHVPIGGG